MPRAVHGTPPPSEQTGLQYSDELNEWIPFQIDQNELELTETNIHVQAKMRKKYDESMLGKACLYDKNSTMKYPDEVLDGFSYGFRKGTRHRWTSCVMRPR